MKINKKNIEHISQIFIYIFKLITFKIEREHEISTH